MVAADFTFLLLFYCGLVSRMGGGMRKKSSVTATAKVIAGWFRFKD